MCFIDLSEGIFIDFCEIIFMSVYGHYHVWPDFKCFKILVEEDTVDLSEKLVLLAKNPHQFYSLSKPHHLLSLLFLGTVGTCPVRCPFNRSI